MKLISVSSRAKECNILISAKDKFLKQTDLNHFMCFSVCKIFFILSHVLLLSHLLPVVFKLVEGMNVVAEFPLYKIFLLCV